MIKHAIAATKWHWGEPPSIQSAIGPIGIVTFIDRSKVREKADYGIVYLRAGFEVIGETEGGLLALGMRPERMPEADSPHGSQGRLETL